ncbi:MAG: quinol:cytochrome C oxidoreductase, partial [Flavobacteriaceae bacterium]|nr:quinol:cytochrome C oxidoreductase [Flavobacteriaceae bacterium]
MYTFSNRLKITSIVFIILGALMWGWGYYSNHHNVEHVEEYLAAKEGAHGSHSEAGTAHHGEEKSHDEDAQKEHDKHIEHVKHGLHNKPWSALYVAAFFFMMIALGT